MTYLDEQKIIDLQDLMGEDVFAELVNTYVENSAQHFEKLVTAIEQGDMQEIRFRAHSLKGGSANMGASALADQFFELEKMGSNGELAAGYEEVLKQATEIYNAVVDDLKSRIK